MSERMRAARLVAESIGALLDGAQHVARCGGLDNANGDYLLDCSRRVYSAIEDSKNVSAVDLLGEVAEEESDD